MPSRSAGSSASAPVAQAEKGRAVPPPADDLAGDGREGPPGAAAPDEAAFHDMHLVPLATPVPHEPRARQQRRAAAGCSGSILCPAAAGGFEAARRRARLREGPPITVACQRQAMPSTRNRRRAPFGGGAPRRRSRPAAGACRERGQLPDPLRQGYGMSDTVPPIRPARASVRPRGTADRPAARRPVRCGCRSRAGAVGSGPPALCGRASSSRRRDLLDRRALL